jgi:hypothetical protein
MTPSEKVDGVREVLREFYATHNPERVNNIDSIMDKYKGFEIELLTSLKEKYNIVDHKAIDDLVSLIAATSPTSPPAANAPTTADPVLAEDTSTAATTDPTLNKSSSSSSSISSNNNINNSVGGGTMDDTPAATPFAPTPTAAAATLTSSFPALSMGLTTASSALAGRLLSGVSGWGLTTGDSPFSAATAAATAAASSYASAIAESGDATSSSSSSSLSSIKSFRMQAEIDRLMQEKTALESTVAKLNSQVRLYTAYGVNLSKQLTNICIADMAAVDEGLGTRQQGERHPGDLAQHTQPVLVSLTHLLTHSHSSRTSCTYLVCWLNWNLWKKRCWLSRRSHSAFWSVETKTN